MGLVEDAWERYLEHESHKNLSLEEINEITQKKMSEILKQEKNNEKDMWSLSEDFGD